MANQRTFYACQAVALTPQTPTNDPNVFTKGTQVFVHGVQSIGFNSTFNVENIFELGQKEIYDSKLTSAESEVTIEKVLDGYKTCWGIISNGATDLTEAAKQRVDLDFAIYADTANAGVGAKQLSIQCTGMYVNNVTYTFPIDGNLTESITLIGNHKAWGAGNITVPSEVTTGDDKGQNSDHIYKRTNVSYTGPGSTKAQNITLSVNLNREPVYEFGKFAPYARFATYPVEATAEVEQLITTENGQDSFTENTDTVIDAGAISVTVGTLTIDLGDKAFYSGTSQSGGDASGGNATLTRSFTTYNTFTVTDGGA